jgi:hypothetical protein
MEVPGVLTPNSSIVMPNLERSLMWTGEPVIYLRERGHGCVIGRYLYLFDTEGRLESMQTISRPVLQRLLTSVYGEGASQMLAARLRAVAEEEPNGGPEPSIH